MRAAAILGPNASASDLREFQLPGVEIVISAGLPPDGGFGATLIFGGDGSVHRQLAAAVASQIPILCVPRGSGNDFARALEVASFRDAVGAWRKFCLDAKNVRQVDVVQITERQPRAAAASGRDD